MTCVFPPDTYSTTGSRQRVTTRPISMWATQWLTGISGTSHSKLSSRATTAHDLYVKGIVLVGDSMATCLGWFTSTARPCPGPWCSKCSQRRPP
jgi:hypothetical protein